MPHIVILSASVRNNRASHRVALFFEKFIKANEIGTVEMLDLQQYKFPLFEERLAYLTNPSPQLLDYAKKITNADGVVIVTPEYNGGYPASLKNAVDVLYKEWQKKPICISTVSDGSFGGTQVITSLVFTLWKIRAWVVPAMFPVPDVLEAFDESGNPKDLVKTEKRARNFINELVWCMSAKSKMANV